MSNYTKEMEAELRAESEWTFQMCEAYAERYAALSPRSVVSKIKNMELKYIAKERETKTSEPQIAKADIVNSIAAALYVTQESLHGVGNSSKLGLINLQKAIEMRLGEYEDNEEEQTV